MVIPSSSKNETMGVRFLSAGIAACIADAVTFPLDTAKVRLQIQGENGGNIAQNKPLNLAIQSSMSRYIPTNNNPIPSINLITSGLQSTKNVILKQPNALLETTWLNTATRAIYSDTISIPNSEQTIGYKAKDVAKPMYRGLTGTIKTIVKTEGYKALYNGLVAGLQRQMSFASIRIGMYENVRVQYEMLLKNSSKSSNLIPVLPNNTTGPSAQNVLVRILAGITTGGMAVLIAQPADVVKVRLQAQISNSNLTTLSSSERVVYNGAMHAYKTIYAIEGLKGLWKGVLPNVTRNAVINASELVGYDLFKQYLLRRTALTDNFPCHFTAAFGAGFVTTLIASPIDVVKTRFMNSTPLTYRGALHCTYLMATKEGPAAFYKGFTPSFMRLASWNVVMFVCYEQIKRQIIHMKKGVSDS